MNTDTMELNLEELEKIGGGEWSFKTLTPAERAEYEVLERDYQASRDDEDKCEAAERALRKFKARMDAKYGNP